MKLIKLIAFLLLLTALAGCGGSSTTPVAVTVDTDSSSAPDATYTGSSVSVSTGSDGKTVIASSSSGRTYEVTVVDGSGNPVEGLEVVFYEDGDDAFIYISDPDGAYSDVVIIGEPDEIDADRARAAGDVGLGLEMGAGGESTVGFTQDAVNLPYVFVSKQGKNEGNWETGCYTLEDIAVRLYDKYDSETDIDDVYSVLSFYGTGADTDTRYLKFKSAYMSNSGARSGKLPVEEDSRPDMTNALTDRMEHVFGTDGGYFGEEVFRLSCYYPDNTDNFYAICEISRDTSTCATQNRHSLEGTPSPTVVENNYYSFTPKVDDTNHSTITYSITNKPAWASFDTSTGKMYGTPTSTGTFSGITITGTDGSYSTSIGPFNIDVINATLTVTGQTSSYVGYDDGYYRVGKPMSLTDNGDTVTDNRTGLEWQDTANVTSDTYHWSNAVAYCDGLSLDGHDDWRLPSVREMTTILYYGATPTIHTAFSAADNGSYWLSTTVVDISTYAYYVSLTAGNIAFSEKATATYKTRCVRGSALPEVDYTRNSADDTVTDNLTGLMWTDGSSFGNSMWQAAINTCEDSSFAGFTDWRMPNIRELLTIANFDGPTAVYSVFYDVSYGYNHSSTVNPGDNSLANVVLFSHPSQEIHVDGTYSRIMNGGYYKCVRGGIIPE